MIDPLSKDHVNRIWDRLITVGYEDEESLVDANSGEITVSSQWGHGEQTYDLLKAMWTAAANGDDAAIDAILDYYHSNPPPSDWRFTEYGMIVSRVNEARMRINIRREMSDGEGAIMIPMVATKAPKTVLKGPSIEERRKRLHTEVEAAEDKRVS